MLGVSENWVTPEFDSCIVFPTFWCILTWLQIYIGVPTPMSGQVHLKPPIGQWFTIHTGPCSISPTTEDQVVIWVGALNSYGKSSNDRPLLYPFGFWECPLNHEPQITPICSMHGIFNHTWSIWDPRLQYDNLVCGSSGQIGRIAWWSGTCTSVRS